MIQVLLIRKSSADDRLSSSHGRRLRNSYDETTSKFRERSRGARGPRFAFSALTVQRATRTHLRNIRARNRSQAGRAGELLLNELSRLCVSKRAVCASGKPPLEPAAGDTKARSPIGSIANILRAHVGGRTRLLHTNARAKISFRCVASSGIVTRRHCDQVVRVAAAVVAVNHLRNFPADFFHCARGSLADLRP